MKVKVNRWGQSAYKYRVQIEKDVVVSSGLNPIAEEINMTTSKLATLLIKRYCGELKISGSTIDVEFERKKQAKDAKTFIEEKLPLTINSFEELKDFCKEHDIWFSYSPRRDEFRLKHYETQDNNDIPHVNINI